MNNFKKIFFAASSLYGPEYLSNVVRLLESSNYSISSYLSQYWTTQNLGEANLRELSPTLRNRSLLLFLILGSILQTLSAVGFLVSAFFTDMAEATAFGLAILLSYPVVWAHVLALVYGGYKAAWSVLHPKAAGRELVCWILENQVVRLRKKHTFTVIAVAGSIGKTSTKLAIAHTLEPTRRVIYQTGNYNDRVTVPLVLFGKKLPGLLNAPAWIKIFVANEKTIRMTYFYDMAVVELGTDHPGDIAHFAYLKPEIAVITAVTPEHMEYFGTLDAVASEELAVAEYTEQLIVNTDDTPARYLKGRQLLSYGIAKAAQADFWASDLKTNGLAGTSFTLHMPGNSVLHPTAAILGEQGVKIVLAAAAAAQLAGLNNDEISKGLAEITPFSGRMQILKGIKNSTLIDDTYNASPVAVKAALDVLYASEAPQRIAILGSMNELGEYSQEAHEEVGAYCRPDSLDYVVTIGADAEQYLAPVARRQGCNVECFTSPYDAGRFVLSKLQDSALIVAEGSQNRVFAEESLKVLLADASSEKKLVRQSSDWMAIKAKQFPR